eukprot:TRINITY_DN15664_c0_g1_i4.p1 TRINITY_DN15664_c0_g1~~TRINITY_DN15664_c0_g1_i4.p1  ORF type:complete len:313 (-),score=100.69 TRINITY_DN15664_c0_g1_i4:241-1179(-)
MCIRDRFESMVQAVLDPVVEAAQTETSDETLLKKALAAYDKVDDLESEMVPRVDVRKELERLAMREPRMHGLIQLVMAMDVIVLEREDYVELTKEWLETGPASPKAPPVPVESNKEEWVKLQQEEHARRLAAKMATVPAPAPPQNDKEWFQSKKAESVEMSEEWFTQLFDALGDMFLPRVDVERELARQRDTLEANQQLDTAGKGKLNNVLGLVRRGDQVVDRDDFVRYVQQALGQSSTSATPHKSLMEVFESAKADQTDDFCAKHVLLRELAAHKKATGEEHVSELIMDVRGHEDAIVDVTVFKNWLKDYQ